MPRQCRPELKRRISAGCLALCVCGAHSQVAAAASGLRWTGDARVASNAKDMLLTGPSLRFRYGFEVRHLPEPDPFQPDRVSSAEPWLDGGIGSWFGLELSLNLLAGATARRRPGVIAAVGVRPWLSRRQLGWFLAPERLSLLGILVPDSGVIFGLRRVPRGYLSWELPLGTRDFQIVPAFTWVSPGQPLIGFASLAVRIPM